MVAIVDYGVGNLFSLKSSFSYIGQDVVVTSDVETIRNADRVILPGVGAFGDAAEKLFDSGLAQVLIDLAGEGKPILGICLGMQLLFEKSYEYGEHNGLGLIKGSIKPIADEVSKEYKIPHIGWNALKFTDRNSPLFKYINEGDCVYFVHSYYCEMCDFTAATADYILPYSASLQKDNFFAMQFHPEKSGKVGHKILENFINLG